MPRCDEPYFPLRKFRLQRLRWQRRRNLDFIRCGNEETRCGSVKQGDRRKLVEMAGISLPDWRRSFGRRKKYSDFERKNFVAPRDGGGFAQHGGDRTVFFLA